MYVLNLRIVCRLLYEIFINAALDHCLNAQFFIVID